MRKLLVLLIISTTAIGLYAGGYRVALQGVRQAAMGTSGSMDATDASVAFYNPAGLAFVDAKISVAAGAFGVFTEASVQNPLTGATATTDSDPGTPFYFAASYRPFKDVTFGVSVTTPFGNEISWPQDWEGRSLVTDIQLRAFFIQPTVAFKFNDWFSAGGGFILGKGSVNLQRIAEVGNNQVLTELNESDANGLAWNIGAYFKPIDRLRIGLAYRSRMDMKAVRGDVNFSNLPTALSNQSPFDSDVFFAELPLPSEFLFGVGVDVTEKLTLQGEVSVTGWSDYQSLDIILQNSSNGDEVVSSTAQNYSDRAIYRFGAQYQYSNLLALRAGYYYDQTPSPSDYWNPTTPSTNQHGITGGLGLNFGNFNVDAYGQYLLGEERSFRNVENNFAGDLKTHAWLVGLGLSYNLK